MANNRPKMSISDRAKQFMSFDALKGFNEELRKKEKIIIPKSDLSDDMKYELDWKIKNIETGSIISVIYYDSGEYVKKTGVAVYVDTENRKLRVVNTVIEFDDIYDIEL